MDRLLNEAPEELREEIFKQYYIAEDKEYYLDEYNRPYYKDEGKWYAAINKINGMLQLIQNIGFHNYSRKNK